MGDSSFYVRHDGVTIDAHNDNVNIEAESKRYGKQSIAMTTREFRLLAKLMLMLERERAK